MMKERILSILEEHCEEALYYDGDNMIEDGVMDSFTVVNVASALESEFDIDIDARYVIAANFKNVEAIIALVQTCLSEREQCVMQENDCHICQERSRGGAKRYIKLVWREKCQSMQMKKAV